MALDLRWIQIVGLGIILHATSSCIIGFCFMKERAEYSPDFPSVLFTFATLNLLTTLNLVPCALANVNPIIGRIFEVSAGIFISDVAFITVWKPLTKFVVQIPPFIGSVLNCVTTAFCVVETAPVKWLLALLAAENAKTASFTILMTAALLALWSAQCSDFFCQLRNLAAEKSGSPACPCPGEEACKQRGQGRSRSRSRSRVRRGLSVSEFESGE